MFLKVSNGFLVLIRGDNDDWYLALPWQGEYFLKEMKFGTMKSMGIPNPRVETDPFMKNGFNYRFIILNDWGPCYLENIDTGTQREIKYIELQDSKKHNPYQEVEKKIASVEVMKKK